jgi:hypothetical protein
MSGITVIALFKMIGLILVSLVLIYAAARMASAAYFKSKLDFLRQLGIIRESDINFSDAGVRNPGDRKNGSQEKVKAQVRI